MKTEEAIKELNSIVFDTKFAISEYGCKTKIVFDMAVEALEKQIPKKPLAEPTDDTCLYYENYCPDCDKLLIAKHMHCPRCGQKLDW